MIAFLVIVLFAVLFYILYTCAFTTKCYRIREVTTMDSDGDKCTRFIVDRMHKMFILRWWTMSESADRYSNGSEFRSKEAADKYIQAKVFNSTKHVKINEPKCYDK